MYDKKSEESNKKPLIFQFLLDSHRNFLPPPKKKKFLKLLAGQYGMRNRQMYMAAFRLNLMENIATVHCTMYMTTKNYSATKSGNTVARFQECGRAFSAFSAISK